MSLKGNDEQIEKIYRPHKGRLRKKMRNKLRRRIIKSGKLFSDNKYHGWEY